jgi:hypothetical protein
MANSRSWVTHAVFLEVVICVKGTHRGTRNLERFGGFTHCLCLTLKLCYASEPTGAESPGLLYCGRSTLRCVGGHFRRILPIIQEHVTDVVRIRRWNKGQSYAGNAGDGLVKSIRALTHSSERSRTKRIDCVRISRVDNSTVIVERVVVLLIKVGKGGVAL